jgi:hypothetical protein
VADHEGVLLFGDALKRFIAGVVTGSFLSWLFVWFLSGQSAHGEIGPTGYRIEDLYQYIVSNGSTAPIEGGHSLSPSSLPRASAMHTLMDVMHELKEKLPCHCGGMPVTGQMDCSDADGMEIVCSSADYPGQDGFYQAGCHMAGRFVDNEDGTVTDNCTGLMWQKDPAPGAHTWQQALQYCEGLNFAGYKDWRLPNARELQSIVDYGRRLPSIDPVFGADTPKMSYWTSSSQTGQPQGAWTLELGLGSKSGSDKTQTYSVRAVRNSS